MSAAAVNGLEQNRKLAAAMPFPEPRQRGSARARMEMLRDTLIVLALQIVFRVTMLLRRWNY